MYRAYLYRVVNGGCSRTLVKEHPPRGVQSAAGVMKVEHELNRRTLSGESPQHQNLRQCWSESADQPEFARRSPNWFELDIDIRGKQKPDQSFPEKTDKARSLQSCAGAACSMSDDTARKAGASRLVADTFTGAVLSSRLLSPACGWLVHTASTRRAAEPVHLLAVPGSRGTPLGDNR